MKFSENINEYSLKLKNYDINNDNHIIDHEQKYFENEPSTNYQEKVHQNLNHFNSDVKIFPKENLNKALEDINSGKMSTRRASNFYGIPRSFLKSKLDGSSISCDNQVEIKSDLDSKERVYNLDEIKDNNSNELEENLLDSLNLLLWSKLVDQRLEVVSTKSYFDSHKIVENCYDNKIEKCIKKVRKVALKKVLSKCFTQESIQLISEYFFKKNKSLDNNQTSKTEISVIKEPTVIMESQNNITIPSKKKPITSSSNTSNNPNYFKQKRAKRGQYRKYESDQLDGAVEVVLSGLMSVHKAGLCFGVPHSTLEYKVKERTVSNESLFSNKFSFGLNANMLNDSLNLSNKFGENHSNLLDKSLNFNSWSINNLTDKSIKNTFEKSNFLNNSK